MNNVIVKDVFEVILEDLVTNKTRFFGITKSGNVKQSVKQDDIRAGIGNGVVGILQGDKDIEFSVTTGFHNDDIFAIQSGSDFESKTVAVQKTESGILVGGKITITGTPKNDTVIVQDTKGKEYTATFLTGDVTVTDGVDGEYYTVIYSEDIIAEVLDLNCEKFPKNYKVQLHSIAYDPDTNTVLSDIYWVFNKALPDGSIDAKYESGNQEDNINFKAMLDIGSKSYGSYLVVPR